MTIADLRKGQSGTIIDVSSDQIPLKLLEMGCLPGYEVTLVQKAPLKDPLYVNINGSYLAIRTETAELITIDLKHA